jgi:hypothetical protein
MPRSVRDSGFSQLLLQDLAASPGRLVGSLRDTLIVVVAVIAAMTLRVPGMELAVALLFLMQRERPGLTLRAGIEIFAAAVIACGLSFLWVQATDGTEVARFLGIVTSILHVAKFCALERRGCSEAIHKASPHDWGPSHTVRISFRNDPKAIEPSLP